MDNRTKEAIRYLGYGRQEADEQTLGLVADAFRELDETAKPKWTISLRDILIRKWQKLL